MPTSRQAATTGITWATPTKLPASIRGCRTGPSLSEMKLGIKDHPLPSRPTALDTSKLTPDATSSSSLLIEPAAASKRTDSEVCHPFRCFLLRNVIGVSDANGFKALHVPVVPTLKPPRYRHGRPAIMHRTPRAVLGLP